MCHGTLTEGNSAKCESQTGDCGQICFLPADQLVLKYLECCEHQPRSNQRCENKNPGFSAQWVDEEVLREGQRPHEDGILIFVEPRREVDSFFPDERRSERGRDQVCRLKAEVRNRRMERGKSETLFQVHRIHVEP